MHFGDRQTNGQTEKQMDRPLALSCSRCRERRLNNLNLSKKCERHPDCVVLGIYPDNPRCRIEPMRGGTPRVMPRPIFSFRQNWLNCYCTCTAHEGRAVENANQWQVAQQVNNNCYTLCRVRNLLLVYRNYCF